MALTVGNLFKESVKYNMKLLAGQAGLCRPVQWIHIIETNEGAQFLHGNEVVITECIAGNDEEKLQRFVGTIYRLHASALIINIGMFIKTVPDSVIAFCEEKQLPLFALPWEVPLVDVTREYCQMIIDNAAQEDTVAAIMKDLIFHVGEKDAPVGETWFYDNLHDGSLMHIAAYATRNRRVCQGKQASENGGGKLCQADP